MRIGMIGLGHLGLPLAETIAQCGHAVVGYDLRASRRAMVRRIDAVATVEEAVAHAELLFVAIQTPHAPEYEGITRLPGDRQDFDYTALSLAITQIAEAIRVTGSQTIVALISTVLPGTIDREIKPLLGGVPLVYNPSFVAMGTVERDFLDPEFVLIGVDDEAAARRLQEFYSTITQAPVYRTSVRNAELIKVAYNTFIGMKVVFANTLMEICHKMGCDVDAVTGALALAHRRLLSPAYLSGGMGDGGACHPRDNIAMSWLAKTLPLSHDLFEDIMYAREDQAEWLADLMCDYELPKVILGTQYKPGTTIRTGSAALLVAEILRERGQIAALDVWSPEYPQVILIGCKEPAMALYRFPKGSVILDPWRFMPDGRDYTVIRIGQSARASVEA